MCLHNETYSSEQYGYSYYKGSHEEDMESLIGLTVGSNPAMRCNWTYEPAPCPEHIWGTCIGCGTLNW